MGSADYKGAHFGRKALNQDITVSSEGYGDVTGLKFEVVLRPILVLVLLRIVLEY